MATVTDNILAGKYDKSLGKIEEAIRDRKWMLAGSLRLGSRVRFPRQTRPTYLAGRIGVVVEFRRTRMLVKLEDEGIVAGTRFRGGILTQPDRVEIVEAAPRKGVVL